MQGFMGRILPQIEAFQQPFELLHGDRLRGALCLARPGELLRFQALEPQAKTVAMPVQHLDLAAVAVDEHVQRAAERIEFQFLLGQRGEPIDRRLEVGRIAALDLVDATARVHPQVRQSDLPPSTSGASSTATQATSRAVSLHNDRDAFLPSCGDVILPKLSRVFHACSGIKSK